MANSTTIVQRRRDQVKNLLKALPKLRKSQIDQAMSELTLLAAISGRFEQASGRIKVLNVYDQKPSKSK